MKRPGNILLVVITLTLCVLDAAQGQGFYPLSKGNGWNFSVCHWNPQRTTWQDVVVAVTGDTTMPNGKTYAVLDGFDPVGGTVLRADPHAIYYYDNFSGQESLLFNLEAAEGQVDTIRYRYLTTSRYTGGDTLKLFGRSTAARNYHLDGLIIQDCTLGEGLGIVDFKDWADGCYPFPCSWWTLRGCMIADSIHGTMVAFEPAVDTVSMVGSCVPPEFWATLVEPSPTRDRIVIKAYDMYAGMAGTYDAYRIDSAYFEVYDPADVNSYEVWIHPRGDYWGPDSGRIPFDSMMYVQGGFGLMLKVLRAGTVVDSEYQMFFSEQTGLVVDDASSGQHPSPALSQNYPNPFNPETVIRYEIPRGTAQGLGSCDVKLVVYDLLGREVAVLVDEGKEAGIYTVRFSGQGSGSAPSRLASGVYVYTLTVRSRSSGSGQEFTQTKRMLLLR